MRNKLIRINNIKISFVVILCLLSSISACSKELTSEINPYFDELMATEDLNQTIQVSYLSFMANPLDKSVFPIGIENNSNNIIDFPVNLGIRIFMESKPNYWIEINNQGIYLPSEDGKNPFLSPKGTELAKTSTDIKPQFPNKDRPSKIRVFVTGNIRSSDSTVNHPVAAYVDININP